MHTYGDMTTQAALADYTSTRAALADCVPPESRISMRVVERLVLAAETAGVARASLLRAAKLAPEQLQATDARISRAEVYRLVECAIDMTADPALGLHWGERLSEASFLLVSDLISHSATLRQGFESLAQFNRLLTDQPSFELHERDNEVIVRGARAVGESVRIERFIAEMQATGIMRLLRTFSPQARPRRTSFAFSAPSYRHEYARLFEGTECFDQPFTGIVFDRSLMSAVSPYKDPDVHSALWSIAEQRMLRLTQRTPFALRVRDLLVQRLPSDRVEMDSIARSLGLSVRSLRRRLRAEGSSYHAITNDALAIVAKQLLCGRARTIQETAYKMGFSDASAFHRAFKRWTGMTPRAFRESKFAGNDHRA